MDRITAGSSTCQWILSTFDGLRYLFRYHNSIPNIGIFHVKLMFLVPTPEQLYPWTQTTKGVLTCYWMLSIQDGFMYEANKVIL